MSEFNEFREVLEDSECEVEPVPTNKPKSTPVWDSWGDEEDRLSFYREHGVAAPEAVTPSIVITELHDGVQQQNDGWSE